MPLERITIGDGNPDVVVLSIDEIDPEPLNPQQEDLATFNELVASIAEDGVVEFPIVVQRGERWVIVGGEHRYKAARLAGKKVLPCIVAPAEWADEGIRHARMIRLNALHGKFDPKKFVTLWNQLTSKYGEAQVKKMTGFSARDADLARLMRNVRANLPEAMKADLDQRADRIQSVNDLAAVVQALFARYGSTLQDHFVLFAFGGKTHLMVKLDEQSFQGIDALARRCSEEHLPLDLVLAARARCTCEHCQAYEKSLKGAEHHVVVHDDQVA